PTNLTATAISQTAVRLAWTKNSTNETSFDVERSSDGVSFKYFATAAANAEQYTDNTASAAPTYYYRVHAVLVPGGTAAAYSNTASVTTPPKPTVTIVATDPDASETGPDDGVFTVSRTGDTSTALTVIYTISGTADFAVDYNRPPTSVVIPAGATSATITIH